MWAASQRRIRAHRSFLTGSYFGLVGALVGVIAVLERRIPQMAANDLPLLTVFVLALFLTAALTVAGAAQLDPSRVTTGVR